MRDDLYGMLQRDRIDNLKTTQANLQLAVHSTNCLTRGDACIYDRSSTSERQRSPQENPPSNQVLGTTLDPFGILEVEMPYETPRLLHHCKYSRCCSPYDPLVGVTRLV